MCPGQIDIWYVPPISRQEYRCMLVAASDGVRYSRFRSCHQGYRPLPPIFAEADRAGALDAPTVLDSDRSASASVDLPLPSVQ